MEHGLFSSTTGGNNITVSSDPCSFIGLVAADSGGAGSVIVKDGSSIIAAVNVTAGTPVTFAPCIPIACASNLTSTGSGAIDYTVFYGNK